MKRREFMRSVAAAGIAGIEFGAGMKTEARGANSASSELPRRPLGRTGVDVTILALGGVIGMQLAPTKDLDPAVLAETALDSGITYFDTAPSYNSGQSETNYGQVVARRRREVFLTTKTQDRTYDGAMKSVEESLKRLRTDHVDLLQIHGMTPQDDPAAWDKPDGVLTAFRKLRDQGATRFIGITGHEDAEILRRAIAMYEFDTLLTTLNPVSRRRPFRESLLPDANLKKMGIIAMKVMGGGNGCLVSGNPIKKLIQPFHDETSNQVKAEDLVRYTLGLPISTAVIGVASLAQLRDNIRAAREMPAMAAAERKDLEGRVG
jgi:uncharacterized protein